MFTSVSSTPAAFKTFPTFDANDLKELEFKCLVSQGRAASCHTPSEDWSGWGHADAAAMWCPNAYPDYVQSSPTLQSDWVTPVQSSRCQRCGKDESHARGDFDMSNGLWYCVACWRQCELINALSSDEEESDEEFLPLVASEVNLKPASDQEDGGSTVGSAQADILFSGESDTESWGSTDDTPASTRGRPSQICMQPSEHSWVAKMRLVREERINAAPCEADAKINESSLPFSLAGRPTPAWASLQPSASSWATQMRLRRQTKRDSDKAEMRLAEDVARSARALLNKMTTECFERLCTQMIALITVPSFTDEHLATIVTEIIIKSTTERAFCHLYADLCVRLDAHLSQGDDTRDGRSIFCTSLQKECEARIKRDMLGTSDRAAVAGLQGDALYEMEVKLKCSRVGNLRFMGELLLRKLLPASVVLETTKALLNTTGDDGSAIESLLALLEVITPKLDSFDATFSTAMKHIYSSLRRRTQGEDLPVRIKLLIRNLLDWLPTECLAEVAPRNRMWTSRTPRRSAFWKPKQ